MSKYENSAARLFALISQATEKNGQITTAAIWADVLGLDTQLAEADPHAVQVQLKLVREELDLLERLMRSTNFSSDLYSPFIARVRSAVSVSNLAAAWANYSHFLNAETLLAFRYCSEILPSEEEIDVEALQSILDKIQALRAEIRDATISKAYQDFILHQIEIVERGIHEYPIKGEKAIKAAFAAGLADVVVTEDAIIHESSSEVSSKFVAVWTSLKAAARGITEVDKVAGSLTRLLENVPRAIDAVEKLLP